MQAGKYVSDTAGVQTFHGRLTVARAAVGYMCILEAEPVHCGRYCDTARRIAEAQHRSISRPGYRPAALGAHHKRGDDFWQKRYCRRHAFSKRSIRQACSPVAQINHADAQTVI